MSLAGLLQSNSGEHSVFGNVCAELHEHLGLDNVDIIIETEVHIMDQLGIKHEGRWQDYHQAEASALEKVESREHVAHLELVLLFKLMLQYDDTTNS